MEFDTERFQIIDHPLVQHKLHILPRAGDRARRL